MRATLQGFLDKAARGENVYLPDVRKAFSEADSKISCNLSLVIGGDKRWEIRVPAVDRPDELQFVREYFYATLYNILSTFGTYPPYARPPLVYLYYTALGQGQDFGHGSAGAGQFASGSAKPGARPARPSP